MSAYGRQQITMLRETLRNYQKIVNNDMRPSSYRIHPTKIHVDVHLTLLSDRIVKISK